MEPLGRYWIDRAEVASKLDGKWDRHWLLGWRDIARASDSRTFVPSVFPVSAVGNKFPIAFTTKVLNAFQLHSAWSTIAFDYVARQKQSGATMNYFIVKQLVVCLANR